MAKKQSAEVVVEGLKKLLISEEQGLDEEVQAKVEMLIAELQGKRPFPPNDPPAQQILDGFHHFKTNIFYKNPECFAALAQAQHPRFLVIACSDSRVCPSVVLNMKPGQAFVTRSIANLVPRGDQPFNTETGAILEYAIKALKIDNILIVGHSRCGGIERLMSLPDENGSHSHTFDFIDDWVKIGLPSKHWILNNHAHLPFEEQVKFCTQMQVNVSAGNLLTYPFVRDALLRGNLTIRGGYYDFVNGSFDLWKVFSSPNAPPHLNFGV
ncbi:BETA CARBONIC ANHYDRASE 2, CARBONIC ANHYDRASE 18, carbonic anhydrase 2 [Hibiscus trionum]|uniref:Carbonic anhydrase n=1 Tax=Hibiscus trionum TaxID=183268 RepID=A0A9W7MIX1_HIBTR|nr:BETA CARBONIC ANHYDRASE 2, CARBONIC ANHYDRASE 18, carbonic anhydrase 2 [Hibiscus trionum]